MTIPLLSSLRGSEATEAIHRIYQYFRKYKNHRINANISKTTELHKDSSDSVKSTKIDYHSPNELRNDEIGTTS